MYVDIAGQPAEPDRQPPGEGHQQARGDQHDAERDEQAAEGHASSIGARTAAVAVAGFEMARRQIPREWLESLIENPEQRMPQPGGKGILQSRFASGDGKMYLSRAVVATEKEPPVVVTVYRTSKIEKYWRPE